MNNTWNTALSPEERLRILLRQMRMDEQSKQVDDSFPTLQHSEIRKYRPHGTDRAEASPLFPPLQHSEIRKYRLHGTDRTGVSPLSPPPIGISSNLSIDTIVPQPALCSRVDGGANSHRRPTP